jgi:hypothetical protein
VDVAIGARACVRFLVELGLQDGRSARSFVVRALDVSAVRASSDGGELDEHDQTTHGNDLRAGGSRGSSQLVPAAPRCFPQRVRRECVHIGPPEVVRFA